MPKVIKDKEAMLKRGNILLNLRKRRNIKQSTVADILGISQQAYLKYEHGEADPTIDALIKLSDFYNVSIECLLGLEKIKKPDILTQLAQEFNLTEVEKALVQAFIAISPKEREKFIRTIKEVINQKEEKQTAAPQFDINSSEKKAIARSKENPYCDAPTPEQIASFTPVPEDTDL